MQGGSALNAEHKERNLLYKYDEAMTVGFAPGLEQFLHSTSDLPNGVIIRALTR